jgi:nucleoside-diphosphate-sugar epimerase
MTTTQHLAVTGATGFLGTHLTERLVGDGHDVRILARNPQKAEKFKGRVAHTVIADITDQNGLAELVKGTDVVIHLVSNFRTASGPSESYRQINVAGTINAFNAAKAAGVKRFIHCSTIGVHGHVASTPANEESPYNPGDLYQETKLEAELFCRRQFEEGKAGAMEVVIIRPCSMYGPGDMRMLKMFKMLANRTFMMIGPCQENFHAVYIDDVVNGFVLAMETPGIAGETFIIGGERYLPLRDYLKIAADAVGAPMPWLRLPYGLLDTAAGVCESMCVPLGIEPPLHRRRVRFYRNNRAFSIDKARKVLGYRPKVDLEEGIRKTVTWYLENGYLKRFVA